MISPKTFGRTLIALAALSLPLAAQAQLNVTLTPSLLPATAGSSIAFSGILQNTLNTELFLNNLSFLGSSALTLDTNVFFSNVPGVLDPVGLPFDTYAGLLFGIDVAPGTLPGDYTGTVTFHGGTDSGANDTIGSAAITVRVGSAPEPTTLALLALGGVVVARRRRRA